MTACEIAQNLVRIPSVNPVFDAGSDGERNVAEWILRWGKSAGFETSTQPVVDDRANVILRLRNGADRPHVLFNGHMDTVGVKGMTIAPFGAEVRDGKLWGRGSVDMKGPDAALLAAALKLRDTRETWRGTLTLAFTVDEENRFRGIHRFVEDFERADYAIVAEPSRMRVVRGCKGYVRFAFEAQGRSAHSSTPDRGRSAILAMSQAILALHDFFQTQLAQVRRDEFGSSTGSVGLIEGGAGVNLVPERCVAQVDVRLLPGQDWKQTYQQIQQCVREQATRVPDVRWVFEDPPLVDVPMQTAADDPLVKTACGVTGSERPEVVSYAADASKLAAKRVPTIILGPGDIAQAHTADEFIDIAELERSVGQYVRLAQALMPAGT